MKWFTRWWRGFQAKDCLCIAMNRPIETRQTSLISAVCKSVCKPSQNRQTGTFAIVEQLTTGNVTYPYVTVTQHGQNMNLGEIYEFGLTKAECWCRNWTVTD